MYAAAGIGASKRLHATTRATRPPIDRARSDGISVPLIQPTSPRDEGFKPTAIQGAPTITMGIK